MLTSCSSPALPSWWQMDWSQQSQKVELVHRDHPCIVLQAWTVRCAFLQWSFRELTDRTDPGLA